MTSSKIQSAPEASFLDIILEAIRGKESTVPVTSLNAYNFLSAILIFSDWPIIEIPILLTCLIKASLDKLIENPGIDSSLSRVPPVKPSPLPDILATFSPKAATIGHKAREVLSPTPPVECLSAVIPLILLRLIISPECIIASVKLNVSVLVIPFNLIAISRAEDW